MMKRLLCSFALLTVSAAFSLAQAASYQVVTDRSELLERINLLSSDLYKRGRVHVVEISVEAYAQLTFEERKALKPISIEQVQNDFAYSPVKRSEHPLFQSLVSQLSSERMKETVVQLGTYRSRYVGSEGNKQAVDWAIEQFKSFGLETRTECFRYSGGQVCNAIGLKRGSLSNDKYVVMGHIDTVGRAFAGADDNGSGVAGVLEMARLLSAVETKHSIEFVAVNAEEVGIVGSGEYVKNRMLEPQKILAALTLDVIGYNTKNIFTIETYPEHEQLAQDIASYARANTSRMVMVSLHAWGSDHIPFLDQRIPATLTSQDWANHNPCYHRACDTIEKVDFEYLRDLTLVNLAYLIENNVL